MSVLIAPDTPYGKELWRWEHHQGEGHPTDPTIRGMRPQHFQAYPAMLYRATQKNPWKFDEQVVADEVAERLAVGQGFVAGGKQAAADEFDRRQLALAVAAAERNFSDRHVSEKARAEIHAAEQASSRHLGEIPEQPIKRRGRKPKAQEAAPAA